MSTLADRLNANARITPLQPQNRVKTITKLGSGALQVVLHGGETFEIAPEDEMFQAFVVHLVLVRA